MKKVLSFALSMVLIVALVLTSMIFASASVIHTVNDVDALINALATAVDGDTITVTGDLTDVEPLTIEKDLTFDGTGSIAFATTGFVIKDSNVTFNGDIKFTMGIDDDGNNRLMEVANATTTASTLTINGGEFNGYIRVGGGKSTGDTTVTINGGKFIQKNHQLFDISNGYSNLTINDGEFVGNGAAMLIRTNDGAAILRVYGGTFTQTGANPILWIRSNEEFTIGNTDGTGPEMTHDGTGYLMQIGGTIDKADGKYNINGGTFNKTGGGSYLFDLNSGVSSVFSINGGNWKTTQEAALIRINDSLIKDFRITGGTFETTGLEPIVTKNNGAFTVTGGTFKISNPDSTNPIFYLGKDKTNGAFVLDGANLVIDNGGKGSVIQHHSACVVKISNFKYEAKGEEPAPILKVDVTESSNVTLGNTIEVTGCEFTSTTSPILLSGLPCTLILDDTTKITAKAGFAIDNKNNSKVQLGKATFDSYKRVTLNGASNGSLSMFVTLNPNATYIFSYNRAATEGEQTDITPYIEAVMANGTTQEIVPELVVENEGGVQKTTVTFKTPEGIADAKNIRLGVKVGATVVSGSIDNWELFATDKFAMAIGDNLIDTAKLYKNQEVTVYDPSLDEGVLMVEGSFDNKNVVLYPVSGADFSLKQSHILIYMGTNGRTTHTVPDPEDSTKTISIFDTVHPAGGGYMYQEMEIEPGKTYRFSVNIKHAATAVGLNPGEKEGFEFLCKQAGNYVAVAASKLPDDPAEYKETYIFTAPNDITVGTNNFKLVFNFGSAFVSGYATNFSVVEVDATTNAVIGEELVKNGDFATGTRADWKTSGSFTLAKPVKYVENFFNKVTPHTPGMLFFDESTNYACEALVFNLKPSTTYEIIYQLKTITYNTENVPKLEIYRGIYTDDMTDSNLTWLDYKDEGNPNVKYEELGNNTYKITWTTDDILRLHNNRNCDFRFQSHTDSAGYYGEMTVYELDANGNRIGNNLVLNGDYAFGDTWYEPVVGYERRRTYLEQEPGFLDTAEPATMIYADGSAKNQNYSTTVTVDASKDYWFSGFYMNMNSAGIKPRILYQSRKADGAYEVLEGELKYDDVAYRFEMYFEIPEDAVVKNGKTVLKVQMNNGSNGKAYFAEIRLAEQGKFTNLITSMSGPSMFQEMPYDGSKFIFYYDDSHFDDGDWSGELFANALTTGAVSGMVFNSSNEPIEGITMSLVPGNHTVKTDEYGNYSFTNINPGNYELYLVEENGNKLLCYNVEVKAGILTSIPVITYMYGSELDYEIPEEDYEEEPEDEDYEEDPEDEYYEEEENQDEDEFVDESEKEPEDTDKESEDEEFEDEDEDEPEEEEEETVVEQTPYGALRGYYLDKDGKPIKGAKIYLKGLGFVTTNAKGMFEFPKLPVGEFEVYTKLADGTAHVFRKVNIEAYKGSLIKLVEPTTGGFNWLWVVIPAGAVLVLGGAAFVTLLIIKKKKTK